MEKWQNPNVIALWIAIAVLLVLIILLFVVKIMHLGYKRMTEANLREANLKLEHQKRLMETGIQAQEKERERIAADLHDSLIGKLSVIRMKSQTGSEIAELSGLLEESISEARRISHDLTPPLLAFSTIEDLADNLLSPWETQFEINLYSDIRTHNDLPVDSKLQLLRILQELLTNCIKHAGATHITVLLRHTDNCLSLSFSDNGKGFDTAVLKKGLGLGNLELRIQYLSGTYRVRSVIGKGTNSLLLVPLKS